MSDGPAEGGQPELQEGQEDLDGRALRRSRACRQSVGQCSILLALFLTLTHRMPNLIADTAGIIAMPLDRARVGSRHIGKRRSYVGEQLLELALFKRLRHTLLRVKRR